MSSGPAVVFSVTAAGKSVAEALIADSAEGESLLAAAREAGSDLAWAHSAADLSALGFREMSGYRRMEGRVPAGTRSVPGVQPLPAEEDAPGLWAAAFRGQWGHKTPQEWPLDLPPGTITLALREDGRPVGVCRVEPAAGLIDGPGLVEGHRDAAGYASLLTAAMAAVTTPAVTVESWGEAAERVAACEQLGLATTEYVPGWQFDLRS